MNLTELGAARVGVACTILVVLGMHVATRNDVRDDGSYQAGYRAASNPTLIRETVIATHTTPAALCNTLAEQALTAQPSSPKPTDRPGPVRQRLHPSAPRRGKGSARCGCVRRRGG